MHKHLYTQLILITVCMASQALQAQWDGFSEPVYGGTTQYSEWEHFITTKNARPDIADGTSGTLTETTGEGFPSSTLNIYSFSLDTQFTIAGSSANDLGQLNLQFVIWGAPDYLKISPKFSIGSSETFLAANTFSNSSEGSIYIQGRGDIAITVFSFFWDLSGYVVNDYQIDFGLAVHTSLDKVRVDTSTATLSLESEPIVLINITTSIVNGEIVLIFPTHIGNNYQIKWTSDLTTAVEVATWNDLGPLIAGDGNTQQIVDPVSSESSQRFYSIIISN